MAVLVRISAAGMNQAPYDLAAPGLHELVKKQPGFIIHVAYPTSDGFNVGEVWESQVQHDSWFNDHVRPCRLRVWMPVPYRHAGDTTNGARQINRTEP